MKKYFFICILFFVLLVTVSAKTYNGFDKLDNLNSKNLLAYLKEHEDKRAYKVCNSDYCDYLKYDNLEKSVKVYINDYIEFVKEKTDEDTSVKVYLQGFKITKIYYFD